jgi:hypothetical protein
MTKDAFTEAETATIFNYEELRDPLPPADKSKSNGNGNGHSDKPAKATKKKQYAA